MIPIMPAAIRPPDHVRIEEIAMRRPDLIAHRGLAARYPENSLPGIRAAMRAGIRYVEVDVQLSADRVPMLFHDADLKRICGVPGKVHEHDFEEIVTLSAAERDRFGERFIHNRPATLQQLAQVMADHTAVTVFVEVKSEAVAAFGVQAVLDAVGPVLAPVAGRCVPISFSSELMGEAQRRGRAGAAPAWAALGGVVERWDDRQRMAGLGLGYLFCDVRGLPASGMLAFESARLAVYEIDNAAQATALAERGVALIETFDPLALQAQWAA